MIDAKRLMGDYENNNNNEKHSASNINSSQG